MFLLTAFLLAASLGARAAGAEPKGREPDPARPTMQRVFDEMKILIPLSLDEMRWSDPASQPQIRAALDRLERAASVIQAHGRNREAGFEQLAVNLSGDLREVVEHYRIGAFDEARFFLTGSLQTCVGCHVRLPSKNRFPLADQLLEQVEIQALDPRERAWLYVTVRRFDAALETWEALMRDPEIAPAELDANGVLVDYLNLAIRAKADIPRARKAMSAFAARIDIPVYLAKRLRSWNQALDELAGARFTVDSKPSLLHGSALAEEAGRVSQGPFGRDGLVQDLAAANQLVRWLEDDATQRNAVTRERTPAERQRTAQAYYWLGVVEARSLDGFWVNLSERHLEAAVRADPKGPFAERAYARLEETQVLGYGGASGNHLPADVWTNLRELRTLMGVE